jgi:VWFA-related protein
MSVRFTWTGVAAAAAIVLAGAGPGAADQTPQQTPQFRAGVDLVQIDVSVLDRDRMPVRDLTEADFTLLENGVPQAISNFAFVDTPAREWTERVWPDDVVTNVPTGAVGSGRLMVLLMDNVNTFVPRALTTAVAIARAIIAQMGPDDLAAVLFTGRVEHDQDFTNDRGRLLDAVEKFDYALGTDPMLRLVRIAKDLELVPDRRKLVFYIGPGFPFNARLLGPAQDTYGDVQGQMSQLVFRMQEVFQSARIANANVYAIDPVGLEAPTDGVAVDRRQDYVDFLRIVSSETGGRALVNLNEPSRVVPRVFRENASYYLLGFQSSNPAYDGKYRRIQVRVNRRNVDVRTRSGYFAIGPQQGRASMYSPKARAERAIAALAADPDLRMSLNVVPIARGRNDRPSLAVAVRIDAPAPRQPIEERAELQLSLFDVDGRPGTSAEKTVSIQLAPGAGNQAAYQVLWPIDVEPGQYQVRVSAQVAAREASGSVVASVTVPDFAREDISLSGVALHGGPALPSVPEDALASLLPVVPTTERVFSAADAVTAFVRIFQRDRRARPVTLTTRILDREGATVLETSETVAPDRFAASESADHAFALPLATLPAGAYVLSIEAALDAERKATREVPFTVR